jgi:hypothetical protein
MALSARLRYEILRRDGHACRYCGAQAPHVQLVVDHVHPVALGGKDAPENLVTACADCNAGKSSTNPDAPLVANVAADALRWGAAMARATEIQRSQTTDSEKYADRFLEAWRPYWTDPVDDDAMRLPADWRQSIGRFHDAGLEAEVLERAVTDAMDVRHIPEKRLFRYFCGICWRIYEERQEIARGLIEADHTEP